MIKVKKVNLHWEGINMAELELEKLILHFEQSNKAEGKSPKTVAWYTEMLGSFANVDGLGFQEQRYTSRSWKRLLQGSVVEIDNNVPWLIISDKAMKLRMLHCKLKWEIPTRRPFSEYLITMPM